MLDLGTYAEFLMKLINSLAHSGEKKKRNFFFVIWSWGSYWERLCKEQQILQRDKSSSSGLGKSFSEHLKWDNEPKGNTRDKQAVLNSYSKITT